MAKISFCLRFHCNIWQLIYGEIRETNGEIAVNRTILTILDLQSFEIFGKAKIFCILSYLSSKLLLYKKYHDAETNIIDNKNPATRKESIKYKEIAHDARSNK